jgi:hypothetical protein
MCSRLPKGKAIECCGLFRMVRIKPRVVESVTSSVGGYRSLFPLKRYDGAAMGAATNLLFLVVRPLRAFRSKASNDALSQSAAGAKRKSWRPELHGVPAKLGVSAPGKRGHHRESAGRRQSSPQDLKMAPICMMLPLIVRRGGPCWGGLHRSSSGIGHRAYPKSTAGRTTQILTPTRSGREPFRSRPRSSPLANRLGQATIVGKSRPVGPSVKGRWISGARGSSNGRISGARPQPVTLQVKVPLRHPTIAASKKQPTKPKQQKTRARLSQVAATRNSGSKFRRLTRGESRVLGSFERRPMEGGC